MNKYKINILKGTSKLNPENDNVDVEVTFDTGKRYMPTFFTLTNIKYLMRRYKKTGECGSGLYFWASDMIIVEKLTEDVIHKTIETLLRDKEFEGACAQLEADEEEGD